MYMVLSNRSHINLTADTIVTGKLQLATKLKFRSTDLIGEVSFMNYDGTNKNRTCIKDIKADKKN